MGFVKWNKGHAPFNGYQSGIRTHDLYTAGQRKYTVVSNLMFKVKGVLNFFHSGHHKNELGKVEQILKNCQIHFLPHKTFAKSIF